VALIGTTNSKLSHGVEFSMSDEKNPAIIGVNVNGAPQLTAGFALKIRELHQPERFYSPSELPQIFIFYFLIFCRGGVGFLKLVSDFRILG
jgi:hypothetical protein